MLESPEQTKSPTRRRTISDTADAGSNSAGSSSDSGTPASSARPTKRARTTASTTGTVPSTSGSRTRSRLSEEQKKLNHIESEQKRRGAIRLEFDILAESVPGMSGQGRSEAAVMHASVGHIRHLLVQRWQLVALARERGIDVRQWEFAGLEGLVERAKRPLHAVLQEQAADAMRRKGRGSVSRKHSGRSPSGE